ncbi:cell surface composition regulator GlgS, partial [Klebsiella pneumoniae]|nr:cell surface composition regulator GlgS [Klebsiella pneumoniae]
MNHHELYSMKNFDFLALSFARMHAQGHSVDLQAIVGNMDEDHREWFCQRYELY